MSYAFTASERAQIQAAIDASNGLTPNGNGTYREERIAGTNTVPLYQTLSNIIDGRIGDGTVTGNDLQTLKNVKLWLDVAIGANAGTGIHSAFIRTYTNRQGQLRLGRTFTENEIQGSSNAVARNLANTLINGDILNNLAPWTVPRIDQIAGIDARAIGEVLFRNTLSPGDTAIDNNAAWSGTLGFNLIRRRLPL